MRYNYDVAQTFLKNNVIKLYQCCTFIVVTEMLSYNLLQCCLKDWGIKFMKKAKLLALFLTVVMMLALMPASVFADTSGEAENNESFVATADRPFRREVSPDRPMWIVHIDTWNTPDPLKIIELIPEDIRDFVVFNISLSVSWDEDNQQFKVVEYGYETAKSWIRACAEAGVWVMVQPASGGPSHFPDYNPAETDYEETLFAEFFHNYPNFIGFNYCEQFWGFDNYVKGFPIKAEERYQHFAGLLELCNKYGGYLVDSWCGNEWGQSINPLAMIKRIPEFEQAASLYSDNFILLEKYTQVGYLSDMESMVLGTYLSGYCGNFGIRYDDTGWTDESGEGTGGYTMATGLPLYFERMILNGATVIDGPELVTVDDFFEDKNSQDGDGFTVRNWGSKTQFKNVVMDCFRKFVSGDFRIPTREEVIKREKFIMVNDVETGKDDDKYCTPSDMYEGLYKMDGDGNLKDNHSHFKKTGRYPSVAETAGFADENLKNLFETVLNKSEYKDFWADQDAKVEWFNEQFPEEYEGDLYAGRYLNNWVLYNPYKRSQNAKSVIPFKYNTAESMTVDFPRYSTGVVQEYADHIDIYLSNYDDESPLILKTDTIVIDGCSSEPKMEFTDRGVDCLKAEVNGSFSGSTYTLTVNHNGPVDITVYCSGSASGRETDIKESTVETPEAPEVYKGILQHEAEVFDTLDCEQVVANGASMNVRDYKGQGYLIMGMNVGAKAKDVFTAAASGTYNLGVRYRAGGGSVQVIVNGKKTNVELEDTDGGWTETVVECKLKNGVNDVELRVNSDLESKLYIDCITAQLIEEGNAGGSNVIIIVIVAVVAAVAIAVLVVMLLKKKKS